MTSWQSSKVGRFSGEWPEWKCSHCGTGNWEHYGKQAKQCRVCGCKKSYAQAVQSPWQGSFRGTTPPPSSASWSPSAQCPDKSQLQEDIKALQVALDALPAVDDNLELRTSIATKIAGKKSAITAFKPLGARIDGCRGALERALARKANAEKALGEAQAAILQADQEAVQLAQQLQQLESEVATHGEQREQTDSIEGMTAALSKVISEMKSSPLVAPEILQETEAHMTKLLQGIRTIMAAATGSLPSQVGAGAKTKAVDGGVHRRVKAKTPTDDTTFTEGVNTGVFEPLDTGAGMSDGPALL